MAHGYRLIAVLSLALLKAGILLVNHIKAALSANNLAVNAALFDGCSNFHRFYFYCPQPLAYSVKLYLYLKIIRPLLKS